MPLPLPRSMRALANICVKAADDYIDWDGDSDWDDDGIKDEAPMISCEEPGVDEQNFFAAMRQPVDDDGYYCDSDFPPHMALGMRNDNIEWKRPHEISDNPVMYDTSGEGGASQLDICQGSLGDCWFLAALATCSMHNELIKRVCPDQSFNPDEGYTGKFKFKFWQYGQWKEVTIDDRLPTQYGKLVYVQSNNQNEFWSALCEKAYAKLNGNYENLEGGHATEAMVDLTGGTVEYIEGIDEMDDDDLYDLIKKALREQGALLTSAIQAKSRADMEAQRTDGLVMGHAYSITNCAKFKMSDGSGTHYLIRLRNPWGACEWNGDFSDSDPRWGEGGADGDGDDSNDENGEFWMPFADYARIFTKVELCRLNITDFSSEGRWYQNDSMKQSGEWSSDKGTAGGCANYPSFTSNPFMAIEVEGGSQSDEILVSLQQKHRRKHKNKGVPFLNIGYTIYQVDEVQDCLGDMIDRLTRPTASVTYTARRDLVKRIKLPGAGKYIIVPTTFRPNEPGKYYMRAFAERPNYE